MQEFGIFDNLSRSLDSRPLVKDSNRPGWPANDILFDGFLTFDNGVSTLVPEAFLYSLLANFVTRTSSFNCFYWHEALRAEKRKPLV